MKELKIKKATTKDFKKIAEISKKEYSKKPYNEKWTEVTALKKIKEYHKFCKIYVTVFKKEIVGFIIFYDYPYENGREGFIEEIVIDSKYQDNGFGRTLLNFVENYLKKKKMKSVTLLSNTKSKAFNIYKKRKYKHFKNLVYMKKKLK